MEMASRLRWIIFITIAAIFLILVGWGLFTIAQNIFNPLDGDDPNIFSSAESAEEIVNSAQTFSLATVGPIVANAEHRSSVITVSENVVQMKIYQGYNGKVIKQKSYSNTPEAFQEFRSALGVLDVSDRIRGTNEDDDFDDEGACATGRRYILEADSELRRWSTSCSTKQGTAGFRMLSARSLFQKQVPDYNELIRGVRL